MRRRRDVSGLATSPRDVCNKQGHNWHAETGDWWTHRCWDCDLKIARADREAQ